MSNEEKIKKALETLFQEVLNKRNYDRFDEIFTADLVVHDGKNNYTGREALKKNIMNRNQAIPDFQYAIDDLIIKGNQAAFRWHGKGKAMNNFSDFKAGRSANYWGVSMLEVNEEGKIKKGWETSTITDSIPED